MKIRKGDSVKVLSGKEKGKTGTVLTALPKQDSVLIEGLNVVKRHKGSRKTKSQGQIIEKSMPIHVSNVALVEGDKAVRVGYRFEGEGDKRKKVRVARPSGKTI